MKFHEVVRHITHTGGAVVMYAHVMDDKKVQAMPADLRTAVEKAADDMQQESYKVDAAWIKKKESEVPAGAVEIYVPTDAEMKLWRKGAVDAWLAVKDGYDKDLARRILAAQGLDDLIADLTKAGAL